jgi:hypothetical protein
MTLQNNQKARWRRLGNRCYELADSVTGCYVIVSWTTCIDYPWNCEGDNFETESEAKKFGKLVLDKQRKEKIKEFKTKKGTQP